MKSIQIKAPAKINIGLNITGKRLDGYHNLFTLFYPIHDLHDIIRFYKNDKTELIVEGNQKELQEDNLILSALELVENFTGKQINVSIELEKNIPVGAGMGGGSSDAAATLLSLNELYDLKISEDLLYGIALELGSDVPFFIKSKPAIGKSRGEVLNLVDFIIKYPILIVNPGIHISTQNIFSKLKKYSSAKDIHISTPNSFSDVSNFSKYFINDFEEIVFSDYPEVADIKTTLINCEAGYASMTGTGSTVFGIFRNNEDAQKAVKKLSGSYFKFISLPQEELI